MASQPLKIRGPQTSDVWKRQRSERPVITITETMFEFGCHAYLPNWLFWCSFFFSPFCFWGGTDAPYSPVLMRRTWWAFSFTQQEPSGGSLMARKATGDLRGLIGLHLCISTITLHFWFLTRNEWGGKVMYERDTVCISECMCYMVCVCVSAGWYVFVCVGL